MIALLVGTCAPPTPTVSDASGYVLLWQVDKLLGVRPGASDVKPVDMQMVLTNIIDVNGDGNGLVVISSGGPVPSLAVHVIGLRDGGLVRRIASNAARADVDASRQRVAFTTYSSANNGSYDVVTSDLATGTLYPVARGVAGPSSCVSWNRLTGTLTFDAGEKIFEWTAEGSPIHRFRGSCPAWSLDGRRLAFRRRSKAVSVYDANTGETTEVYRGGVTEAEFAGPMFWSPDHRYIAATVHSGADGSGKKCLAIDTLTTRVALIHDGFAFCGPWLSDAPRTRGARAD
jgi:hypothetical protein